MITIRPATRADFPAIWKIFREIMLAGDPYVNDESWTEEQTLEMWFGPKVQTYLALDGDQVVGAYKILPNMPGRGSHIANGSYIVDAKVRGKGLGRIMVEHSLREAKRSGFIAIQFNCVVSSNVHAVHLYHSLGFVTLATVPKGFNHAKLGLIDSYVMYRSLDDIEL